MHSHDLWHVWQIPHAFLFHLLILFVEFKPIKQINCSLMETAAVATHTLTHMSPCRLQRPLGTSYLTASQERRFTQLIIHSAVGHRLQLLWLATKGQVITGAGFNNTLDSCKALWILRVKRAEYKTRNQKCGIDYPINESVSWVPGVDVVILQHPNCRTVRSVDLKTPPVIRSRLISRRSQTVNHTGS